MSFIAILIWLLGQGFVVEQATQFLKALPFVKANPKIVVAALNVLAVLALQFFNVAGIGEAVSSFLLAVIAGLSATGLSVGFYETFSKAFKKTVSTTGTQRGE